MDPFALSHNDFVACYEFTLERRDRQFVGPNTTFKRAQAALRKIEAILQGTHAPNSWKWPGVIVVVDTSGREVTPWIR